MLRRGDYCGSVFSGKHNEGNERTCKKIRTAELSDSYGGPHRNYIDDAWSIRWN